MEGRIVIDNGRHSGARDPRFQQSRVQHSAGLDETGLWLPRNQRREFAALERAAWDQLQVRSQIENRILQHIAGSYLDRRFGGSSKIVELTISGKAVIL